MRSAQAGKSKPFKRRTSDFIIRQADRVLGPIIKHYAAAATSAQFRQIDQARQLRATFDSMEYADTHMQGAVVCSEKREVRLEALRQVRNDGLFLEFGVWRGRTINFIAERHSGPVHGFDSFEGLPEDWGRRSKGFFATGGRLPEVLPNVQLHAGWFDQTLPRFVCEHNEPVAFLHVDCDLYSSTKTIFQFLGDHIVSGTVILFDEYFNYPGWREHEYKAFQEFVSDRRLRYRYLAYNQHEFNVATMIE